jgi:phosphoglycolate phosphatase
MPLKDAVIAFDLDGTLVDTAPDLIGALNETLAHQGLGPLPLLAGRRLIGHGVRSLVVRGFAEAGRPLEPGETDSEVERFARVYSGRIALESRPYQGVEPALDRLRTLGARLVVCTNKRTDLSLELLDALELTPQFDAVVGSDQIAQKPDPRLLWLAIERAGGVRDRALYVGDSYVDQAAGRAAGVPVVGVSYGYVDPPLKAEDFDALIDRMDELPPIAERLFARRP